MRLLHAIRYLQLLFELDLYWWSYVVICVGGCCVGVGHYANWVIARTDTVMFNNVPSKRVAQASESRTPLTFLTLHLLTIMPLLKSTLLP
jgi:hypothetical protein